MLGSLEIYCSCLITDGMILLKFQESEFCYLPMDTDLMKEKSFLYQKRIPFAELLHLAA